MSNPTRRDLKNEYKTRKITGGIYAIVCEKANRRWLKSTTNMQGILNRFAFAWGTSNCPDPAIVNEWKQYGENSFTIEVLEELDKNETQTSSEFADDIQALLELWEDQE